MAESKNFTNGGIKAWRSQFGSSAYIGLTVALSLMLLGGTAFFYSMTASLWSLLLGACEIILLAGAAYLYRPGLRQTECGELAARACNNNAKKLTLQNHYYQLLHDASLGMLNRMSRQELMQSLMRLLAEVSGIPHSFLFLLDPSTSRMMQRFGTMSVGVQSYGWGEAAVGTVWETGKTLVLEDYPSWEKHDPSEALARLTSILAVPVWQGNDKIVGVIGLAYVDERHAIEPEIVEFVERAAQLVAVALDNLTLVENLRQSEAWARAIFEQSSEAIALFDVETRKIVAANERCADLLAYDTTDELLGLTAYEVTVDSRESIDRRFAKDYTSGILRFAPEIRELRRKDGASIEVERTLAQIKLADRVLLMSSFRDITVSRKLQKKLEEELQNAATVQRSLLAPDCLAEQVHIRTFYQPYREVSGDFFGYGWNYSGTVLQGYLIDVMGHGIGTALQTAALNVLFHQAMDKQLSLKQTMIRVNRQAQTYFSEGMFAAAICFELDLSRMTLGYVSAGINYFMASARNLHGLVRVPGSLVGVNDDPDFEEQTIAVQAGDVFYFVTDGLMDAMIRNIPVCLDDFERTLAAMRIVAPPGGGHDDASALCLQVCGPVCWPLVFELSQPEELKYLRGRLRGILHNIMNEQASSMEVVMNEAVNNALRSVNQTEKALVRIKINKVGSRLICRIRDSGKGFNVNGRIALLKREEAEGENAPDYMEGGRGLAIMMKLSDRLVFNSQGNEVLVMKKFRRETA